MVTTIPKQYWSYKPYKFMVKKVGSYYHVIDSLGKITLSTSYFSKAVNEAFAKLTTSRTYREKVLIQGNLSIDDILLIPDFTELELQGIASAMNSLNKTMLKTSSTHPKGIEVHGGVWFGNGANQSSNGLGFEFLGTEDAPNNDRCWIHNTNVMDTRDTAIYCANSNGCTMTINLSFLKSNCYGDVGRGLDLESVTDFIASGLDIGANNTEAIKLGGCGGGFFSGLRTDGSIYLQASSQIAFGNLFIDCFNRDLHGITIYDSSEISIDNGVIRADSNSGYNTKYGIYLIDDASSCKNNRFSNLYIGRPRPYNATQRWAYGIYEDSGWGQTPNYNQYININGVDCNTGALRVLGANSDFGHIIGEVVQE